jgi:hypothetical protein
MWIVIAGTPMGGYSVHGLFKTEDDARAAGKRIGILHGCGYSSEPGLVSDDPWYVFPLHAPDEDEEIETSTPAARPGHLFDVPRPVVVFSGDIESRFEFFGPFRNEEDAYAWIDERTPGYGYECIVQVFPPFAEEMQKDEATA